MKVPASNGQSCNTAPGKPLSCNNTALNTTFHPPNSSPADNNSTTNLCYEPTSVLDLQRSPSPSLPSSAAPLSSDTGKHPAVDLDNLEGWDSILSDLELGLGHDTNSNSNSNSNSKLLLSQISPCDPHLTQVLPDFSQPFDHISPPVNLPLDCNTSLFDFSYVNQNLSSNFGPFDLHHHTNQTHGNSFLGGLDFIDDLIRAAQAFESNDSDQLHLILTRLNQRLRSPVGRPLQRAAFYFKEALQNLADSTPGPTQARPTRLTSYEVVQTIRAHKAFAGISPVSLFSTFAANQAILEAVDGSPFIHVIDFDIGLGGHWASLMRDLADKFAGLRITAIIPEEFSTESKLVRENLSQFARDLNLNFQIEYVLIPTFEILSFKSMKFIEGEKLAVHLSPSVFNRFANNSRSGIISKFLADLRGISPISIVVVDREVGMDPGTASFGTSFIAGLEFYAGMLESLDAAAGSCGDSVRRIETFVLRPRIMDSVAAAGKRMTWREAFVAAGMRMVRFSHFTDFQVEWLLRRAQVGGFHVAKRHGEMMLCWHDRPLVATSAWRC